MAIDRRRVIVALGAATIIAPYSPPSFAAGDPVTIVREIYTVSAGKNNKWEGSSGFFNARLRQSYFSKTLRAAIAKVEAKDRRDGDVTLDFDPVSNSQDPSVEDLKISRQGGNATKATVVADFKRAGDPERVLVYYDFVLEGGAWKLDDIRGSVEKDPGSVRDVLKQ